jgi:hypothetical protein
VTPSVAPAAPADTNEAQLVREEVGKVLNQCEGWKNLAPAERSTFARNMTKVASYLAEDPGWLDSKTPLPSEAMAEALGPVDDLKGRLAKAPGQVGQEFQAGGMRQGVEEFANLVKTVDFPKFVSGLIQGVFQAIVDASIQQMEAYGELLAATAKTVDQFASDHITDDQAREQVANRFPSIVKIERSEESGTPRLVPASEETDTSALQQFASTKETIDFASDEGERKFITAAKLEMARQRQKMMALMVLLGINRIVVTNGRINAKVVFDIRASDQAARRARAGLEDIESTSAGTAAATWQPWGAAGAYAKHDHMTTVRSSIDDDSESKAKMKAQLSGEVRVNFKSETLPPERMLDKLQFEQMNYIATPGGAPATGSTPPAPTPTPTPTPAGGKK